MDDADEHIAPKLEFNRPPAEPGADSALLDDAASIASARRRRLTACAAFGAFVGIPVGALMAAACCWLIGLTEWVWQGAGIGALVGPLGGAFIGWLEGKLRSNLARPDIATFIGVIFGLAPAFLAFTGIGPVSSLLSGYVCMGWVCAGPMLGLLIGAILDRAYESFLQGSRKSAYGGALAGFASCLGAIYLLTVFDLSPDPSFVAQEIRRGISAQWKQLPEMKDAKVQKVTLAYQGGMRYTGFVDATINGRDERWQVNVTLRGDKIAWEFPAEIE